MSRTPIACRDMVWTQIERQRSLNLDGWSSDSLRVDAEAKLGGEVFMLSQLREILKVPHVHGVTLKGDSSYSRSDDTVYYSAEITLEVEAPGGEIMEIRSSDDVDTLFDVIENMDDSDPAALEEYRATHEKVKKFVADVIDLGELNHTDFWKTHDEFSVSDLEFERHVHDGDLDLVGLADHVFGRKPQPIPLDRAPARWTSFQLYRIRERLKAGMPADAMDDGGQTPLNAAVWHGVSDAVVALLVAGADPNATDVSGVTPLATAVHQHRSELLDVLINNGADIDGPLQSRTVLFALNASKGVALEELLQRGLNLDVRMPDGGVLSEDPERYCPKPQDARLLRAHLTTGAIDSAMSGGSGTRPGKKKDLTL